MPFRDSDEATRARADALAEEVAELTRERDALLAEKAGRDAKAAAPEPTKSSPASSDTDSTSDSSDESVSLRAKIIGGVIILLAVGVPAGVGIREGMVHDKQRAAYDAAEASRRATSEQWDALVSTEPCVRDVLLEDLMARELVASGTYRTNPAMASATLDRIGGTCLRDPEKLRADASLPAVVRQTLGAWLDAEAALAAPAKDFGAYFSHDDWKEDGFRGADEKWKALAPILDVRRRALLDVTTLAVPALRDVIRKKARDEEALRGPSELVTRIDLGLLLWDVATRAEHVALEPSDPRGQGALHDAVLRLRDQGKSAPLEVRRDLRRLDYLLDPIAEGGATGGERLLSLVHPQPDFLSDLRSTPPMLPDLPPKPEEEGW